MNSKGIDKILSVLFLVVGSPFILIILTLDFIFTLQFPLIVQTRAVSLNSKKIKIVKIRTIIDSKDFRIDQKKSKGILYHESYRRHVPAFCVWLRKSGLDEILQLINVIKGEMSLIGPRPLLLDELKLMKEKNSYLYYSREELNSIPGITGYWQVFGDREKGIENLVEWDEYYERNKSFLLNFRIMLKTISVVFFAAHSDSIIRNKKAGKHSKNIETGEAM